jgi:parvulin-like peptidyl-prolyl isomerase
LADANRRYSGSELDRQVEELRANLLLQMIDRKILVDHAKRMFNDMSKVRDGLYQQFKQQQNIKSDEELARLLAQDGLTVDELKHRLVELYAPEEVLRMEILGRNAVPERDIDAYYAAHPEEFRLPAEVTFREIVLLVNEPSNRQARRADLEQVQARLAAGEGFAELAQELSDAGTREAGGLLGPLPPDDLADELETVVLSAPIGEPTTLEASYGFHVVRVESRLGERLKPVDEVRERLRRFLEERRYRDELKIYMTKARANAEWCVKPKYKDQLSIESPQCDRL